FSMQAFPGYGIQMVLDGQYISKRYVSAFDIAGGDTELDPYILSNLTIGKQFNEKFAAYGYISNIFNEEYEVWRGYLAPDLTGGGGIRIFW
ncbi:MAG: TonB-dependent receptor, partial [bacterium]|nr:TonB-dependent receptor [bacterium]